MRLRHMSIFFVVLVLVNFAWFALDEYRSDTLAIDRIRAVIDSREARSHQKEVCFFREAAGLYDKILEHSVSIKPRENRVRSGCSSYNGNCCHFYVDGAAAVAFISDQGNPECMAISRYKVHLGGAGTICLSGDVVREQVKIDSATRSISMGGGE